MTFRSHPSQSELLAYAEQQLAETEESRIKTHMADCTLCRTAVDQVLRSASQLKSLPLLPLSSAAEGRIRAALKNSQSYNQQTTPLVVKRWIAVAAAIVVGVASLLLYYQNRIQAIELHRPAAALSSFEQTAARLHSERNENRLTLDYTGDSPEKARNRIAQHVGV
jgi:anti-sigma factor RsiW